MKKELKVSRVNRVVAMAVAVAGLWAVAGDAYSSERRFVYSYEAEPFVPKKWEMETWLTWKDTGSGSGNYTFRHEFEYAFTEKFQLGLYLPTWEYEDDSADIKSLGIEGIYNLTDPNESFLGSSLYGEVNVWDEFVKLETKLLLQKNFGPLEVTYNAIVEAEWEHAGLEDTVGELKHTLGVSYMVSPKFAFGAEGFQELKIPDWSWDQRESAPIYLGPNASLRLGRNWLTVAALWEVTQTEEEDFQIRAIWGLNF